MESQGKAIRPSIFSQGVNLVKRRSRMDVSVLAARYEQGLDLWTGQPLAESQQRPQNGDEVSCD